MMDNGGGSGCASWLVWLIAGLFGMGLFGAGSALPPALDAGAPTLAARLTSAQAGASAADLQAAQQVIESRLAALAHSGQISSSYSVETDPARLAITVRFAEGSMTFTDVLLTLTTNRYLEFVDFSSVAPEALRDYTGRRIATTASVERSGDTAATDVFPTVLTYADVRSAEVINDGMGGFSVQITLTEQGAAQLGAFTEAHIGSGLAIVLDGQVLSVPRIQSRVESPVVVSGAFTDIEAQTLAAQIVSRPLPIALSLESIGPAQ